MSSVALGGASWSFVPSLEATSAETPDEQALATIHAAIESGVTLVDTAHVYTTTDRDGHGESLIARGLASHPDGHRVAVATKGGHFRKDGEFPIDASRNTIRRHCDMSLQTLGVERLWLYQLHWPDPSIRISQAMNTFAELQAEGVIQNVGVSNVSLDQLEEARRVVDVVSVQNPFMPSKAADWELLRYCEDHSIAYLVYSPLRSLGRRADGANEDALASAAPAAARLARELGLSIQRLLLSWMISLSPALIVICGASRPETVRDSALASSLTLNDDELQAIHSDLRFPWHLN